MRIFISYAREDQAAVEALNADLERARCQVWMDDKPIGNEAARNARLARDLVLQLGIRDIRAIPHR